MLVIEPIVLLLVIIGAILLISMSKIKELFINTVLGLIILALANIFFSLGIKYTIYVILVCAIGGMPGAFMVIIFHILKIAF